jgi:hypothetical protein
MRKQQHTHTKINLKKINKQKKNHEKDVRKYHYFLPAGFCITWIHIATEDVLS